LKAAEEMLDASILRTSKGSGSLLPEVNLSHFLALGDDNAKARKRESAA